MSALRLRLSMFVALLALGWFTVGWQTSEQLAAGDEDKLPMAEAAADIDPEESDSPDESEKDEKKSTQEDEETSDEKADKDKKSSRKDSNTKRKPATKKTNGSSRTSPAARRPGTTGSGSSAGGLGSGTAGTTGGARAPGGGGGGGGNGGSSGGDSRQSQTAKAPLADDVFRVFGIQDKHTPGLMKQEGIIGTATTVDGNDGKLKIMILTSGAGSPTIPKEIEGIPVIEKLCGPINFLQCPPTLPTNTQQTPLPRPIPIGVSTAPMLNNCALSSCYSGTLGCRLKARDGSGYYALSNNHVFAFFNLAPIGASVSQPSPGDSLCVCDNANTVATLTKFMPYEYGPTAANRIDAAIAKTDPSLIGNSTLPDGYGTPKSKIIPLPDSQRLTNPNIPGIISSFDFFFNQEVLKYGRTTGYTRGRIVALNATLTIAGVPGVAFPSRWVDQILIFPSGTCALFGAPGDSGSLIVNLNRHPVALLYAGGGTLTIGNPIGPVLDFFDMDIDGEGDPLPPGKNGRGQPNTP
jgi:hypothetical protein